MRNYTVKKASKLKGPFYVPTLKHDGMEEVVQVLRWGKNWKVVTENREFVVDASYPLSHYNAKEYK